MPPCEVCGCAANRQDVQGVFCPTHRKAVQPPQECYRDKSLALKWYENRIRGLTHPATIKYVKNVYAFMIGPKTPRHYL